MTRIIPLLVAAGTIFLVLVAVSLLDIFLVFTQPRFYSNALFITTFGVGGVFAGVLGYMQAIDRSPKKDELARWSAIGLIVGAGVLFFFLLSRLEGGEYGAAFKAYGITMALTMILFVKGKVD